MAWHHDANVLSHMRATWKSPALPALPALPAPSAHRDRLGEVVLTELTELCTMVERYLDLMLAQPLEGCFRRGVIPPEACSWVLGVS